MFNQDVTQTQFLRGRFGFLVDD